MRTVLVTGGAGFIGSHLVDLLIRRGYRTVVIDNLSSGKRSNVHANALFYRVDVRSRAIATIFQKRRPQYVFHFAAQKSLRLSIERPIFDAEQNIIGSLNILDIAKRHRARKIVFASTGGAYGFDAKVPTTEQTECRPVTPYGIAKYSVEQYLNFYWRTFKLPYVALRYANVYGPRQDPQGEAGVVAIFAKRLLHGQRVIINGDGKQTRDFVYVQDAVDAALRALKNTALGSVNIGTSRETSINQLLTVMQEVSHKTPGVKHGPALADEQRRSALSYVRAKSLLGWKPRTTLQTGIKKTWEWYENNEA